uniref:Uncharacterized protein n=1 Tax=Angiostrongylus cantonensis TaxID=6313 RepID=A0A0K0D2E7_ANGCA
MWIVWLLAAMNSFVGAGETTLGPHSGMAFAQRLVDTLPRLPNVIHSQMEGKPEKLREMISHMLGDGLLSQLVVDPLGVAEGMGVPLSSLGINKTAVEKKFDPYANATISDKLFNNQKLSLFPFVTETPTTTEKVMYLDGVPIKDFDQFVRSRNLEERFSTKNPLTTTTPLPSANDIAAAVLDKLKMSLPYSQQRQPTVEQKPITNDNFHNLNVNTLDSRRIQDVDTLLRRAPQKFDMLEGAVGSFPSSFIQSLEPEIDEVVTSLRTGNVMNVERVRQLQNILQTYEQSLQTKELIAKRKQLQLLQNELVEQRRKIEEQKRMEEELRKKEQELEEQRKNMEIQLRQQLHMWHNSFSVPKVAQSLAEKHSMMPLEPQPYVSREIEMPISRSQKSFPIVSEANQEKQGRLQTTSQPLAKDIAYSADDNMRHLKGNVEEFESQEESEEIASSCACQKISLQKMKGKWLMALASKPLIGKMEVRLKQLLKGVSNSQLSCSTLTMSTPKVSAVAQDAPISWEFRTATSPKLYQLSGSALSLDHRLVQLQISDLSNDILSIPSPCNEVALVVRNLDKFFDEKNNELVTFLRNKIATEEIDDMDIVPFANDCS